MASALLAGGAVSAAKMPSGSLDGGFGRGGKVTTPIGVGVADAYALVIQPDGKLVAAGVSANGSNDDFALVRYNANGTLDKGFGGGGKVTTPIGAGSADASALVLQRDGKLVVAGRTLKGQSSVFALIRYNRNGTLDASFGKGGKVTTPIGSLDGYAYAYALALQKDGKLVAAGSSNNGSNDDFALVRYNANGTLDASFGRSGKVTTPIGPGDADPYALAIQRDGKLVAAGRSKSSDGSSDLFALVRYNANGTLDASFGRRGKMTTQVGPDADAYALGIQPNGKLVAAGRSYNGSHGLFALVRYNANGMLETSFGRGGKVTTPIGSGEAYADALVLQQDGKLVAARSSASGSKLVFALIRYNANGALDASFGNSGTVTTPIGQSAVAYALALQPDGKLVAAGSSTNGSRREFTLVRYNP